MTTTPQTSTTPFSGVTRAQVTPERVEAARKVAQGRGDKQFGFRIAKGQPYHTLILTNGGTLRNPTNSCGESDDSDYSR